MARRGKMARGAGGVKESGGVRSANAKSQRIQGLVLLACCVIASYRAFLFSYPPQLYKKVRPLYGLG